MEKGKQVGSSSFTMDLFGPKDSSKSEKSSSGLFGSVFGPPSTGLGRNSPQSGFVESLRQQDLGSQYYSSKHGTADRMTQKSRGEMNSKLGKDRSSIYQSESAEPCYMSSSIYYGAQEVYSPTSQNSSSQHIFKKDGGDDDPSGNNGNCASRGNWWQGSLYY